MTSLSSVTLSKTFENEQSFNNRALGLTGNNMSNGARHDVVDALIEAMVKNVPTSNLEYVNGIFAPVSIELKVELGPDIFAQVVKVARDASGYLSSLTIEIDSNSKPPEYLVSWIKHVHEKFIENMENDLGSGQLYFNQVSRSDKHQQRYVSLDHLTEQEIKRGKLAMAEKHLCFTKSSFSTNKSFSNLYGSKMRKIAQRLDHFLNNKQWYDERGIQYQFTIMMSGGVGRGKSSIIRAIANRTNRHIVNVAFHNILTATQLKNLMFSPHMEVFLDEEQRETRRYRVPLDKRIIVFDELDASSPLVRERTQSSRPETVEIDELTMADVLNAFQGDNENTALIRCVNTNYPEMLDKAFKRPGRIDMSVDFGPEDDVEIAQEMFKQFYNCDMPVEWTEKLKSITDFNMSPVELQEVFFRHFGETDYNLIMNDVINYVRI